MSLENITYQSVVDTVKTWIKSNCSNIANYSGMSNAVKNGYSYTIGSSSSGEAYSETASCSLTSSITGAVAESVVDTDMTNFLTTIGVTSLLSQYINPTQFYKFINDMCCFCCTKLAFVTSQTGNANTSSVKYLIYWSANTNYNYDINIVSSSDTGYLLNASDVNEFWQNIVDMMVRINGNIRVLPVKYNYSLS